MNFGEIKTECQARGFDFDSDTRWGYWINRAYTTVCERQAWPFLETTATGASPLAIDDLGRVLSVADTTNDSILDQADIRALQDDDPGLDDAGTPDSWYRSGVTTIAAWPTDSVSLSVRYIKAPTLSSDSDEPLIPERFHYLLVDGALTYAYRDSDNFEAAQQTKDAFEEGILEMADSLADYESARMIEIVAGSGDQ